MFATSGRVLKRCTVGRAGCDGGSCCTSYGGGGEGRGVLLALETSECDLEVAELLDFFRRSPGFTRAICDGFDES